MRKQDAFTLIELLVTMVVLAIILAMAIPAFSVWLPRYHLRSGADDLYSELQLTKMQAIRNNGEWAVKFIPGAGTYQVISGGTDGDYSTAGDNVVEKTFVLSDYGSNTRYGHAGATVNAQDGGASFDDEISFSEVTGANDNTVVFNPRGMINSLAGGYVYLQNNANDTYAVGVLGSGVILMRKWNGAAWE